MTKPTTCKQLEEIIKQCDGEVRYNEILASLMVLYKTRSSDCKEYGYGCSTLAKIYDEKWHIIYDYLKKQVYFGN